jgi:predicted kinase
VIVSQKIKEEIIMAKLTLIRGVPGSGKSTLAKEYSAIHLEADMFFQKDGVYDFDREKVRAAHEWCQRSVAHALNQGIDVVVANTFVKVWEIERYINIARKAGESWEVLEATGNYKNIHGVPDEVVERMLGQWEEYKR